MLSSISDFSEVLYAWVIYDLIVSRYANKFSDDESIIYPAVGSNDLCWESACDVISVPNGLHKNIHQMATQLPINFPYAAVIEPQIVTEQIWMQKPKQVFGCPPGLEYLTMVDQLLVHQQIELLEVVTDIVMPSKFFIKNSVGQQVYYAAEESDAFERQSSRSNRSFVIHVVDNMGLEIIQLSRQHKCCTGPSSSCFADFESCSQVLTVDAPPGQRIGYVVQEKSCCAPKFSIKDSNDATVLQIKGPGSICQGPCCTQDIEFQIYSADIVTEIGRITKQWAGYTQENYTRSDNFGVSFPMDLCVKTKALCLAAVFLIDFIFFEFKKRTK